MTDTPMYKLAEPFDVQDVGALLHESKTNREAVIIRLVRRVVDLENVLLWIRINAGLHHMGGAFDPKHMWALSSLAHAGLEGLEVPDFGEAMERGKQAADEWSTLFADLVEADPANKDDDAAEA